MVAWDASKTPDLRILTGRAPPNRAEVYERLGCVRYAGLGVDVLFEQGDKVVRLAVGKVRGVIKMGAKF